MVHNDHGAAAAAEVARRMVVPFHRPGGQAQFSRHPLPQDNGLAPTYEWAVGEMHRDLTVGRLASHAGMSARTFARRFRDETGMSPMRWVAVQRLLEAQRLLEVTDLSIDDVAERCGLRTAANLRLHMGRHCGTTPTAYRTAHRFTR
jgi:transcriptional regulator GlxA family with amidase domain